MRLLPPEAASLVQDYELFQVGILPYQGGWDDQVASWCEAMVILGSEFAAINAERREEERRNSEREARRRGRRH
jgi:hypothetical protein